MNIKEWLTLFVAIAAVVVAGMQYYLQTRQLKQAMFEKRFKVYEAVLDRFNRIQHHQTTREDHEAIRTFVNDAIRPSLVLFGSTTYTFLDRFHALGQNCLEADDMTRKARAQFSGDMSLHSQTIERYKASLDALADHMHKNFDAAFTPYFDLAHDRTWIWRAANAVNQWINEQDAEFIRSQRHPALSPDSHDD